MKNGMLFGRARKLCPDLLPMPYDFEAYRSVSQLLYDTVARLVAIWLMWVYLENVIKTVVRT